MSLREQIIEAIKLALVNQTTAMDRVFRSREEAITREETPAIIVRPDVEDDDTFSDVIVRNTLTVQVAIMTRGLVPDSLADSVAVAAHRIIVTDLNLASLVVKVRKTGSKWDFDEADSTAGTLLMMYQVTYLSKANDIAASP